MNTGHDGSLTTIHANSPADAIMRLETMVAMSGFELPPATTRAQIGSAIDLVLQVKRFPDGKRSVISLHEITGFDGDRVGSQEIFTLVSQAVAEDETPRRNLVPTGVRPEFLSRLESCGIKVPDATFEPAAVILQSKKTEDAT
jgi:pilus assembly protein CpaF